MKRKRVDDPTPELEYNLSVGEAEKLEVRVWLTTNMQVRRSLLWLAQKRPAKLEEMLDRIEPGSKLFYAVTLVYNARVENLSEARVGRSKVLYGLDHAANDAVNHEQCRDERHQLTQEARFRIAML